MALKRALVLLFILIMVLTFSGCVDFSLPVYQRVDKGGPYDEDGLSVVIDGVTYINRPAPRWSVMSPGKSIGYAGNWDITIMEASGDSQGNFVCFFDSQRSWYGYLYRKDRVIPEPTSESIDKIEYSERGNRYVDRSISDKAVIQELFSLLGAGERLPTDSSDGLTRLSLNGSSICLFCFSDAVSCTHYDLNIYKISGKLVCGNYFDGYVEIPAVLLEKLAGHPLDMQELLRDPNDDELIQ